MTIENLELMDLKNDIVFQELFGKQKNGEITKHFLSLVLGKEITNIDLDANKEMLGNRANSKISRLDIRAKFNDGEDCDIEIQVEPYGYMEKRILEYWSQMYTLKISRGEDYGILKPSIVVLITDYKIQKLVDIEKYHTIWKLREEDFQDIVLTQDIEIHILEIPKIRNVDIKKDELALWLKFIQHSSSEEVTETMEEQENKYLKQAMEELKYLSGKPGFKRLVEAREGFLRDKASSENAARREGKAEGVAIGEKKGRAEGKLENQKEIARKLLEMKLPIEQIVEATGLTKEEIEKLK